MAESSVSGESARPVVLDLEDPYFDGQTLPDALRDYAHVHSSTGVCVKRVDGPLCDSPRLPSGKSGSDG